MDTVCQAGGGNAKSRAEVPRNVWGSQSIISNAKYTPLVSCWQWSRKKRVAQRKVQLGTIDPQFKSKLLEQTPLPGDKGVAS